MSSNISFLSPKVSGFRKSWFSASMNLWSPQHLFSEHVWIKGYFAVKCCWGWWFMIRRASRKRTTSTGNLRRKAKDNSDEPRMNHWSNIWVESAPWNSPIKWRILLYILNSIWKIKRFARHAIKSNLLRLVVAAVVGFGKEIVMFS